MYRPVVTTLIASNIPFNHSKLKVKFEKQKNLNQIHCKFKKLLAFKLPKNFIIISIKVINAPTI